MTSCDDVQDHLSSVHDGEGPVLAPAPVADHMAGCVDCTRFVAGLAELDDHVAAFVGRPVPDGTADVLVASAARRASTGATSTLALRRLLGLAAAVQAVLAVLTLFELGGQDVHALGDLAVYELAAAAGLATVAVRPALAAGLLPTIGLAAVAGLGLVVAALVGGASPAGELGHLVLVVACWPLAVLASRYGGGSRTVPA